METLTLFKLMDAKLSYVSQRQGVLASNLANANTPGYQSFDLKEPDFKKLMETRSPTAQPASMKLTNGQHFDLQTMDGVDVKAEAGKSYEVSPDGNAVDIEEQMFKATKNNADATLVLNLYTKQLSLLRMAAGGGGR